MLCTVDLGGLHKPPCETIQRVPVVSAPLSTTCDTPSVSRVSIAHIGGEVLHATGILLTQLVFFHPLCRGFRECVTKANTLWHFEAGQTRLTPRLQLLRRGLGTKP